MRVCVAVPTIPERAYRRADVERMWTERTPEADVQVIFSEAGESWAAGLNDVWEQVRDEGCDIYLAASDDMVPADERWLPTVLPWLERGHVPAPKVEDPRFTSYGGHPMPVPDGTPSEMTAFIIMRGDWCGEVFPLPEDLHYFADNAMCMLLTHAGHDIVAVPTCRILHLHAQEGRGAGYGSENTRLYIDTVRYTRWLELKGIERTSLPRAICGHMWEEQYQDIGRRMGA